MAQRVSEVVAGVAAEVSSQESEHRSNAAVRLSGGEEVTFGYAQTSSEAADLMSLSWEIDVVNASPIMGYPHSTAREIRGSFMLRGSLFPPEGQGRWSRLDSQLGLSFAVDPRLPWNLLLSASSGASSVAAFVRVAGDCRSSSFWVSSNRLVSIELMPRPDGRVDLGFEVQRRGLVPAEDAPLGVFVRSALLISPSDPFGLSRLLVGLGRVGGLLESVVSNESVHLE